MIALSKEPLAGFVEAVASDRPAPGCGAAAAVGLALAAACACKAFRISARSGDPGGELSRAAGQGLELARAAIAAAQRDAEDFAAVLHANDGDPEPARVLRADGAALLGLAGELRRLVEAGGPLVEDQMAADLAAALALAEACERIQRRNLDELSA